MPNEVLDGRDDCKELLDEVRSIEHTIESSRQRLLDPIKNVFNRPIDSIVWRSKDHTMPCVPNNLLDQNIPAEQGATGK